MKKTILKTLLFAVPACVQAQTLYDTAPQLEKEQPSPMSYSVGANLGYDQNITPTRLAGEEGFEDDSIYLSVFANAGYSYVSPRSNWTISAGVSYLNYLESPEAAENSFVLPTLSIKGNLLPLSYDGERVRLTTNFNVSSALEPDYDYGLPTDRQVDTYLTLNYSNQLGYKWTEVIGSYTGAGFSTLLYNSDFDNNDRFTYFFSHQMRYRASETTNYTLDYRYSITEADGTASDSTNQFIALGIEHRFSERSVIAAKAGIQIRDVENPRPDPDMLLFASAEAEDTTSPYFDVAYRYKLGERTSLAAFVRYQLEDYANSFDNYTYDTNKTLRFGLNLTHQYNSTVSFRAGVNYVDISQEDGRNADDRLIFDGLILGPSLPPDLETNTFNIGVGVSVKLRENVSLTGSYNYTFSDGSGGLANPADAERRDYNRSNASVGIIATF